MVHMNSVKQALQNALAVRNEPMLVPWSPEQKSANWFLAQLGKPHRKNYVLFENLRLTVIHCVRDFII